MILLGHIRLAATYTDIYKPDEWITINDIWNRPLEDREKRMKYTKFRWINHLTWDTQNNISIWIKSITEPEIALNFSKFGKKMAETLKYKTYYIPHGVDTKIFTPVSESKKSDLRAKYNIPQDTTLFLSVGHNQVRKNFDRVLTAFSIAKKNNPNMLLWFHCSPDGSPQGGWNLPLLAKDRGCEDKVLYSDKASKMNDDSLVSPKMLAELYQIADVHVLPSAGGGFEIPMIEAMACGTPNITTAYCTGPEFTTGRPLEDPFLYLGKTSFSVERYGILVPYKDIIWHQQGGAWCVPDVEQIAKAMLYASKEQTLIKQIGVSASEFVKKEYDWSKVLRQWDRLINSDLSYKEENSKTKESGSEGFIIRPIQALFRG